MKTFVQRKIRTVPGLGKVEGDPKYVHSYPNLNTVVLVYSRYSGG
jgi:hypothetical protein